MVSSNALTTAINRFHINARAALLATFAALALALVPTQALALTTINVGTSDELKSALETVHSGGNEDYVINLTADFTYDTGGSDAIPRMIMTGQNVTIYGHGHTLSLSAQDSLYMRGGTLSLGSADASASDNALTIQNLTGNGGTPHNGAAIYADVDDSTGTYTGSTLNMYPGVAIHGCSSAASTAVTCVSVRGSVFNMYGGEISGGSVENPLAGFSPAVFVASSWSDPSLPAAFNMSGGIITDNTSYATLENGLISAPVVVQNDASFTMTGGSITGNRVVNPDPDNANESYSAGVFAMSGSSDAPATIELLGGSITDNDAGANSYGGGVFIGRNVQFTLGAGMTVTGNKATWGGGLYFGSQLPSTFQQGAVLANNTGISGGADIMLSSNASIQLPDASAMGQTFLADGQGQDITGWYVDGWDPSGEADRWASDAASEVDVSSPISGPRGLVAAWEQLSYTAHYVFASSDSSIALPAAVTALLPEDSTGNFAGDVVTPPALSQTSVTTPQGTWTFQGWSPASATISDADVTFTGTWSFEPAATYTAHFTFTSSDSSLTLPDEVTALLPEDSDGHYSGEEVTPPAPSQTSVTTSQGTWTFQGWSPASATIDNEDVTFTGSWSFAPAAGPQPTTPATPKATPKTGDAVAPFAGVALVALAYLAAGFALRRREEA